MCFGDSFKDNFCLIFQIAPSICQIQWTLNMDTFLIYF